MSPTLRPARHLEAPGQVVTMRRVPVLKEQFGPTLPQLLRRLPGPGRAVVLGLAALLLAGSGLLALAARPAETFVVVRGATTFNLAYGAHFERTSVPGALLALRRERADGLFLESYVVRPLTLAPYRGAAAGTLPVFATSYLEALRRRYRSPELVLEGRTRINNALGYQLVLRAKLGPRTLYVRHLLLVPEEPEGARRGVVVELETTPGAGTPNALGAGNAGPLKLALRSFRFGTERTGGTE